MGKGTGSKPSKGGKPTGAGRPSGTAEQRAYYGAPTTPSGTPRTGEPSAEFKAKLEEDIKAQQEAQRKYIISGKEVSAEEYQKATAGKEVIGRPSVIRDTRTQREKEVTQSQRESQRRVREALTDPTSALSTRYKSIITSGMWEKLTPEEKVRLGESAGSVIVPGVTEKIIKITTKKGETFYSPTGVGEYTGKFLVTEKYPEKEQLYQTIRKKSTGEITYKPYGEPVEKQHFIFGETPEAEARRIKHEEKKAKEKVKPYYEKVKEIIPEELYPSYWTKKYFPEQAPFIRKGGVTPLDILPWKKAKEFLKKSEQWSIGFGETEWKELREKPSKYITLAAITYGLPYAGKAVTKLGAVTKISKIPGVVPTAKILTIGAGVGLTGMYGYQTYEQYIKAESEYAKGGIVGRTILELGALGAGAYTQRRVSGYISTLGREEIPTYRIVEERIISGKQTFPTAPVKEHMKLFIKGAKKYGLPDEYKIPGERYKFGVWKTVPESWAKKTEILPGGYELPGASVAPSVSPHFLRTLVGGYFGYEFPIAKSPAALRIYTKGFKYGKVEKVGRKFKWIQELEKGYAYLPRPWKKTEEEALIPVGTEVNRIGRKYFFRWKGIRIPIEQYEAGGIGKVIIDKTLGKAISKYSYYGKGEGLITPYAFGATYLTKYKYKKPPYKYYKPSRYEPYYTKPYYAETYKPYKPSGYIPYKYEPYRPYRPSGYKPHKPTGYIPYYKPYRPTGVTPYYYGKPRQPTGPPPTIPGLLLTPSGIGKRRRERKEKYFIKTTFAFSSFMRGAYGKQLPRGRLWSSLEERRVPEWLRPKVIG